MLQTPEKLAFMTGIMETMCPYAPWKAGNENDMRQFRTMKALPFDQITCPTFVGQGTLDAGVKFYHGVRAAEHLPNSERYWIEDGDHLAYWLSPDAAEAQSYALDFVRRAEDTARTRS